MTREEARLTLQENFGYLTNEHPRIVEALKVALDVLFQPSLPSDLDEAEFEYAQSLDEIPANQEEEKMIYDAFKAGAEWRAGKYKTLGETEIYLEDDGGEAPYTQEWLDLATTEFAVPEGFKPGDKVIVQIRKK